MKSTENIQLLIIDPQNDFCDIPEAALPVPGADADMRRLAEFIERAGPALDAIHVTMDSHNPIDIAHPAWWVDKDGRSPEPFTVITALEFANGDWKARDPAQQGYTEDYLKALERNARHLLIVWPEHCLIGSWGHNVHASVKSALDRWARSRMKLVDFVVKGTNPRTEHYSAIQAEVPDAADKSTQLNNTLINTLKCADTVVIAGEALSHCVASTVRDIGDNIGEQNIPKLILLTDCASPVSGFENLGEEFVRDLSARGMRTAISETLCVQLSERSDYQRGMESK